MVLCAIANSLFVGPVLWLGSVLLPALGLVLALTLAYRACATLMLPAAAGSWLRARLLKPALTSQLVLVTGASSGIGLALVKHLHKLGYSVVAAYWPGAINEPGLAELRQLEQRQQQRNKASQPKQLQQIFVLVELDVRHEDSVAKASEQIRQLLAQNNQLEFYALVNNAGLGSLQPFAWLQRAAIRRLIETNLLGSLLMTREFMPLLADRSNSSGQRGQTKRLLFVSSGLGFVPGPNYATYGVTKAAQLYLAKALNLELRRDYLVQAVAVVPHNFIKNTSICAANVKQNQLAWNEMQAQERELYKSQYERHCERARELEHATRSHQAISNRQQQQASATGPFLGAVRQVLASLRGENTASTLEESGILEGFELALRLHDPPEILFAGDGVFQLLVGSLLLILPTSLAGLLSNSIESSLYR